MADISDDIHNVDLLFLQEAGLHYYYHLMDAKYQCTKSKTFQNLISLHASVHTLAMSLLSRAGTNNDSNKELRKHEVELQKIDPYTFLDHNYLYDLLCYHARWLAHYIAKNHLFDRYYEDQTSSPKKKGGSVGEWLLR